MSRKMKKTKYLTDKEPKEFKHLIQPLADERIKAMIELKKRLVVDVKVYKYGTEEYNKIQKRYDAVTKAIIFWRKLLEEE
jgi:ribonuclease HIII